MKFYAKTSYLQHVETGIILISSAKLALHPMMIPYTPSEAELKASAPQAPAPSILSPAPAPAGALPPAEVSSEVQELKDQVAALTALVTQVLGGQPATDAAPEQPPAPPAEVADTTASETMRPLAELTETEVSKLNKPAVVAYLGDDYNHDAHWATNKAAAKKLWRATQAA